MRLLAVSGGAGVGKSTLIKKYLSEWNLRDVALADQLKIRAVATGAATYEEAFHTKPAHVRTWLQEEGTERGRNVFGEDVWCRALFANIDVMHERWGLDGFVVSDVRFPNEVEFIRARGGKVIRIEAPERYAANGLTDAQRSHQSERALDGRDDLFDFVVQNDPEHADTIRFQLATVCHSLDLISREQWRETVPASLADDVRYWFDE